MAMIGIAALVFTACEPKNKPDDPQPQEDTTVVTSFPRKHLIEEFTGQTCGYCPYGMDCIHEFMGNDTNWVLILHHYGYQKDHFSVSGSKTITTALGVSGAPTAAIDRAKAQTGEGKKLTFHPAYMPEMDKSQFVDTTYASIKMENTFDAASRELKVRLTGRVLNADEHPNLFMTVIVKESGMIDTQADYYGSYEGWQEFRHANAVRVFLTAAKGDSIHVENGRYSMELTTTLKDEWVADNCMAVAFITEDFKPVVQAEQRPVVAGTQGGADILHGGITPVPVADYYPEPDAANGPSAYSGKDAEELANASAAYTQYPSYNFTYWQIAAYSTNRTIKIDGMFTHPYAMIYMFTDLDVTTLPTGTFELNLSEEPGTVLAGYRDDESMSIGGSSFYLIDKAYYNQGYLVPDAQWLIVDGTLTIGESSWELIGHTYNGADIHLYGNSAIQNNGKAKVAPKRTPRKITNRIEYCIP